MVCMTIGYGIVLPYHTMPCSIVQSSRAYDSIVPYHSNLTPLVWMGSTHQHSWSNEKVFSSSLFLLFLVRMLDRGVSMLFSDSALWYGRQCNNHILKTVIVSGDLSESYCRNVDVIFPSLLLSGTGRT